jgi:hypothetical protein
MRVLAMVTPRKPVLSVILHSSSTETPSLRHWVFPVAAAVFD